MLRLCADLGALVVVRGDLARPRTPYRDEADRLYLEVLRAAPQPTEGTAEEIARVEAKLTAQQPELQLTPLGLRAVNRSLRAVGIDAPVIGELRGSDATTLCAAIGSYDIEDFETELAEWLAGRTAKDAVGQLVELVRGTDDSGLRMTALTGLSRIDPEGFDALTYLADEPGIGPIAKVHLINAGRLDERSMSREETLFVLIDTIAALDDVGSEDVVDALGPVGSDPAAVEALWRVPHPSTGRVLERIAQHHPNKKIAKAARKALFKVRSNAASS
jgi:hypothetical protein